jgi:hypothetical protein
MTFLKFSKKNQFKNPEAKTFSNPKLVSEGLKQKNKKLSIVCIDKY